MAKTFFHLKHSFLEIKVLYDKECVWSLSWVPGTKVLNPWNVPNDKNTFVVHVGP